MNYNQTVSPTKIYPVRKKWCNWYSLVDLKKIQCIFRRDDELVKYFASVYLMHFATWKNTFYLTFNLEIKFQAIALKMIGTKVESVPN